MQKIVSIVIIVFNTCFLIAQTYPFQSEIDAFKMDDQAHPNRVVGTLFIGSSSIRLWKNLDQVFPEFHPLNRGFGGAILPHIMHFAPDMIYPYNPRQVVIYCGENDLVADTTLTAMDILNRTKQLINLIKANTKAKNILIISLKPSLARWNIRDKNQEANRLIKAYCNTQKNLNFLDVWDSMLDDQKMPMKDIFVADGLHMNEKGYAIWNQAIRKYLIK